MGGSTRNYLKALENLAEYAKRPIYAAEQRSLAQHLQATQASLDEANARIAELAAYVDEIGTRVVDGVRAQEAAIERALRKAKP